MATASRMSRFASSVVPIFLTLFGVYPGQRQGAQSRTRNRTHAPPGLRILEVALQLGDALTFCIQV